MTGVQTCALPISEPGDPKPTLSNIALILAEDTSLQGRIRFNDFTQYVEIDGVEKTEDLDTHVAISLDHVYGIDAPTDKVREALGYVARRLREPVRQGSPHPHLREPVHREPGPRASGHRRRPQRLPRPLQSRRRQIGRAHV